MSRPHTARPRTLARVARVLSLALLAALPGCWIFGERNPPGTAEELGAWMTGVFSSAAQAAQQPDDYHDVRIVMVPIWTERADGPWLYVEQALASALERPYRQRVYQLVDELEGVVRSDIYELPGEPLELAGAWADTAAFDALSPADLLPRDGCSMRLTRLYWTYTGETRPNTCPSSLRGASFATSIVSAEPDRITSWDRGFDAAGVQIWGAELGPYVFDLVERDALIANHAPADAAP